MSSSIWTRCGGKRNCRAYAGIVWRYVEAQQKPPTRKLVDSDIEQHVLEALLDEAKPPVPPEPEFQGLDYLLFEPFRHPPLAHGSRFGTREEPALWYGAEEVRTTLAEMAYYRLLFLEGSEASLEPLALTLTVFQAAIGSDRTIDLSQPPFAEHEAVLSSPVRYDASQALGAAMRADGVEVVRYVSARDVERGKNVALFTPRAFTKKCLAREQLWRGRATRSAIEVRHPASGRELRFPREQFLIEGVLPAPAI